MTPSQFTHEAKGLRTVQALLPDVAPFRAWSNFEFRDHQGRWHEVDLLVLGRRRLHLVELKYYSGVLRGNDLTWLRDGHRPEDSPLKLARRKAQRLRSKLMDTFVHWASERHQQIPNPRTVIPYVQEAVFLHHPSFHCALPPASRIDLFGPDGATDQTGLPGISERLLESPSLGEGKQISDNRIATLLELIGLVRRRQREVGSWVIDEQPIAEGEGWQDWPAFHRVATTHRARIRFYVTPPGAPKAETERLRRAVENEYRLTTRLNHDGLLKPRDLVHNELGVGLVYPHDQAYQRLDLWLAGEGRELPVTDQLALLREVAETLAYAHRHRVAHRGLTPSAVWVRRRSAGRLSVLLGDWQMAGRARTGAAGSTSGPGSTGLGQTALAGTGRLRDVLRPDVERRFAEVFQAPEGVWNPAANRIPLDVFSLGALAYYLLTARPPASDRVALHERLARDGGLDLAAELPQVAPALRRLVLDATRRAVSERLADVPTFLARLADAERELATPEHLTATDPLEAVPGAVLAGRFRLERRLGAGSTAVGLLVTDLAVADGELRVLKVARDDAAGQRLVDEAEVLRGLRHPRVVRLVDGPLELGGRRALLLEFAGEQTLAEVLPERARLSLDLLERWGTELLDALVALDRAGVDHRDIKPANLGVREGRGDRVKHLTLFDFSLSRAGATAVSAGTPPYLDPFLEQRGRYDSAAERYAAAVVLFEMATGQTPVYGDGQTHPAVIDDEATVVPELFDPAVAARLVPFFRTALARDAGHRHDTAADMLAEWRSAFAPLSTTDPDDADARAAAATAETRLADSGLSARALSALEPLGLATVADLLAVDPVRLARMSGVANATRREITARAKAWRARLGAPAGRPVRSDPEQPDLAEVATLLVEYAGSPRAVARRRAARLLLGLEGGLDAFATLAELAGVLDATQARGSQHVAALQRAWAGHEPSRRWLDRIATLAREALGRLGGVAEVSELAEEILGQSPPSDHPDPRRLAAGLLRVAVDRVDELERAGGLKDDDRPFVRRRHGGRTVLLAFTEPLLDAADAVARAAQRLVADARAAGEPVVPRQRAAAALAGVAGRIVPDEPDAPDLGGDRLVRLAGRLAAGVAVSGRGELHDRGMPAAEAVRLTLSGLSGQQPMRPQEVADRVRARFPALPPLPDRPRLDEVVAEAGLPLVFDQATGEYRAAVRPPDTTGLGTRPPTSVVLPGGADSGDGYAARRLAESVRARSFLAVGVEAARMGRAVTLLRDRYGARVVDVTGVLVAALRDRARAAGVPWDAVRAADAAQPGTRDALGLAVLVEQSLPDVEQAVAAAAAEAPEGGRPLVLVELAPLARYGHLNLLSRWTDLTARRRQAVWAVVPQLVGNLGPLVDGRPLPLAAPGQFLRLDAEWFADPGVTAPEGVTT